MNFKTDKMKNVVKVMAIAIVLLLLSVAGKVNAQDADLHIKKEAAPKPVVKSPVVAMAIPVIEVHPAPVIQGTTSTQAVNSTEVPTTETNVKTATPAMQKTAISKEQNSPQPVQGTVSTKKAQAVPVKTVAIPPNK